MCDKLVLILHDVFFHYLRKVSKYNSKCEMKFTSTDSKFLLKLDAMMAKVSQSDKIKAEISANTTLENL